MAKQLRMALAVLAVLVVAAFWYWSPYWSLYQMRSAARAQDAQAFNAYVDYPRLRASLQRQFAASRASGPAMAVPVVDDLARPETVMRAMRNGRLKPRARLSEEQQRARIAAQNDIDTITLALRLYKLDHGAYPSRKQGLAVLVKKSAPREDGTREPYLQALPKDPWGRSYRYTNPGKDGGQARVYHEAPPDEQPDTEQRFVLEREGTGTVVMRMTAPTGEPNPRAPALVFHRAGFADWKLVELRMPAAL